MMPQTFAKWFDAHAGEAFTEQEIAEVAAYYADKDAEESRAKDPRVPAEPNCPHGETDGQRCAKGACPVVQAPDDTLRMVATRDPLPGTLGETAKRYALAELARRSAV